MTEDIPLEITSSDMANLPIFIAVLIVAIVVVRVYFSIKHNEKPPIARVFWCATLLIPLGMVAAWITNQLLVNEDNSLWVLSYSALGTTAVILLVEPLVSGLIDQTDLATGTVACICRDILVIAAVSALSFVSLEIACNETFYRIPANSFGFSVGLLATVLLSLYLLGQRHGGVMALVPVACCILGIAEHFVITFKGEAKRYLGPWHRNGSERGIRVYLYRRNRNLSSPAGDFPRASFAYPTEKAPYAHPCLPRNRR